MRTSLSRLLRAMKFIAPAAYVAGAILVWVAFAGSNPDGLANIWIAIYTAPIVAVGTFVLGGDFPYLPGGYYQAHALYFAPSVALLALALFLVFHGLEKLVAPAATTASPAPRPPA
jgi:hypothetical protein